MFTGIIQKTSRVISATAKNGGLILSVAKPAGWQVKRGDSIAVNGVCSTVVSAHAALEFFYMPETLEKTYLASVRKGHRVNVEQSLRANGRLDGHMVVGHVDAVGTVKTIQDQQGSKILSVCLAAKDRRLMKLAAEKGSVCLEGISLTVVRVGRNFFTVHLIPYTWEHTNLWTLQEGSPVNVEFDILAKYVSRIISARGGNK